ncbi:50S ribosomal protein L3 glutamine methyltransferase [Candidatus Filomicrobium marinum]|uniref:50S ribosomal protein L3 glutamine methyltransferase n=1 Tax=Candidatus Filomicrobium marinum TaxID=1608628 RepID=A0A0D6JCP6_9HYPH|nr:50S ribosomal protein L3 N(5)-glutamine methyltransferase [Candidatus Filomicrobium marinum]CFX12268.1 50S ribosomal protein L3 glutamine methyltransferase [Candidatus Filomicrobium marinum]CPR17419.1 50S ribosomal protein L3 glutamine methyltransferase [Candidatus Filomicrobium marinum]
MTKDSVLDASKTLFTVRDWLRYGVSEFTRSGVVFGHGTSNALDEAAYLILHALSLPIDQLEPWLDTRLTMRERETIADLFEQRITTRKPAAYLTGEAWLGPYRFTIDERVIVPRSYIGELLINGLEASVPQLGEVRSVLDLCTGSGCLAIVAALEFEDAYVDAVDISADALAVAARNVTDYGLADRVRLVESDVFSALEGQRYDLIIANPPYVTDGAVADFPPEYQSEPVLAHAGGTDGLNTVRRIMENAADHLEPDGLMIVEIGTGRDTFETIYPDLALDWLNTEASEGEVFAVQASQLMDLSR